MLDDDFLVLVNAWWEPLDFVLPATRAEAAWRVELDSYDPSRAVAGRHAGDRGDWADPNARTLALYLDGSDDPDTAEDGTPLLDDDFLVLVNSWWEPLSFTLPPTRPGAEWHAEIDSYDPAAPAGAANARPAIR